MNDDMNLDPVDDEIGRRLRRMAPSQPDTSAILAALGPRMSVARRRRRVAVAGSSALAMMLLVGTAAALSDTRATRIDTQPADTGDDSSSTPDRSDGSDPTEDSGTDPTGDSMGTDPTNDHGGSGSNQGEDHGSGSTETTDDHSGGTGSGGTSSSSQPTSTTDAPAPSTATCNSPGGSITVRLAGGTLTLLAKQPAAGYDETQDQSESDRIRIEYTNVDDEDLAFKVEARVLGGSIVCDFEREPVDESTDTTDDSGGSGGSGSGGGSSGSGSGS